MSVRAFTEHADALLTKIKRLIDQEHIQLGPTIRTVILLTRPPNGKTGRG
jgi:hypothetical protein